jgi:hypothetical protein
MLLILAVVMHRNTLAQNMTYTIHWAGNSNPKQSNYIENMMRALWVSQDGEVYSTSSWDENGRSMGIYSEGNVVSQLEAGSAEMAGTAVAGNTRYVWSTTRSGTIKRWDRSSKNASGSPLPLAATAIAASETEVFACIGNAVRVFSTDGASLRQWTVTTPGPIAIDKNNQVWIGIAGTNQIKGFDAGTGAELKTILLPELSRAGALAVDNSGNLIVGDQGPDLNVKIYGPLSAEPALLRSFGEVGGYLAGNASDKGRISARRFTCIKGVGCDAKGRLYVGCQGFGGDAGRPSGTDIRVFEPSGELAWDAYGLHFEGIGTCDPGTDGAHIYTGSEILAMDYSEAPGKSWSYYAHTINPSKYPTDPRLENGNDLDWPWLAEIDGKRIMLLTSQNPGNAYVYRFNPATDGHIAIPTGQQLSGISGVYLEKQGNLWLSSGTNVTRELFAGFADNGNPQWGTAQSWSVAADFNAVERIEYDVTRDALYVFGYTKTYPSQGDWGRCGRAAIRYDNWLSGARTRVWEVNLQTSDDQYSRNGSGEPKAVAIAGDYLFVSHFDSRLQDIRKLSDGSLIGHFQSNAEVDVGNDIDSQYGFKAYLRNNGLYVVTKDDYNCNKVVVYTWCPTGNCPEDIVPVNSFSAAKSHAPLRHRSVLTQSFSLDGKRVMPATPNRQKHQGVLIINGATAIGVH